MIILAISPFLLLLLAFFRQAAYSDGSDAQAGQGATAAGDTSYRRRRSCSNEGPSMAKGSMFSANKQIPSHFTVHPDWASEHTKPAQYKRH